MPRRRRKRAPVEQLADDAQWRFTRTGQRIVWWEPARADSRDWGVLATMFLLIFGGLLLVCVVVMLVVAVLMFLSLSMRGAPFGEFPDAIDHARGVLAVCALIAAAPACILVSEKHVRRFDIDLDTQEIITHESRFPNRKRVCAVPFSAIVYLRPRRWKTYGGAELELVYVDETGTRLEKRLGSDISVDVLQGHLDCLRPTLGDRILELDQSDT